MHDPSILAYDFRVPVPVIDRWATKNRHKPPFVSRMTGGDRVGSRVYPWWQLRGYNPRIGRYAFRFPTFVEVWHDEPDGADSGTVCDLADHGRPVRWGLAHRSHLRWKIIPVIRVRSWLFVRCEDCGRRFRWREAHFSTGWEASGSLHDQCNRIRHLRRQVATLAKYVRGEATDNERWNVQYDWLDDDAKSVAHYADMGVGEGQ